MKEHVVRTKQSRCKKLSKARIRIKHVNEKKQRWPSLSSGENQQRRRCSEARFVPPATAVDQEDNGSRWNSLRKRCSVCASKIQELGVSKSLVIGKTCLTLVRKQVVPTRHSATSGRRLRRARSCSERRARASGMGASAVVKK